MKKSKPRNVIHLDGLPFIKRGGRLWADYDVASEYIGCSRNSFAVWVWRHNVTPIKHGRKSIVLKSDIDRVSGAALQDSPNVPERLPFRARR